MTPDTSHYWHDCLGPAQTNTSIPEQVYDNCRGNEAKPCAELEKEEKVQLLKVDSLNMCYAMLCYAMLCYAMPCSSCCHVLLCHAMPCCAIPCSSTLCYVAMPCLASLYLHCAKLGDAACTLLCAAVQAGLVVS